MSRDNPLWGALRIHGEWLKLGIDIGETSVGKYMVRGTKPPSQTWRTFLETHVKTMVSADFFKVPTIRFQVLYVFLVPAHDRRQIVHFNVRAHPTAEWATQQVRELFPLSRSLGTCCVTATASSALSFGGCERHGYARSPFGTTFAVATSIRRTCDWHCSVECLDYVIVFNKAPLYRQVKSFVAFYHESRTHRSLNEDTPEPRLVQPRDAEPS
jgi:putative transposase